MTRMSCRRSLLLVLFTIAATQTATAQQASGTSPPEDSSTSVSGDDAAKRRGRWAVLPIIFYSPDTRLAFGVLPQYIFYVAEDTRSSTVRLDAYYTRNQQFHLLLRPEVWLPGNAYRLAGNWSFKEWPTDFYGIGPRSRDESKEEFTERLVALTFEAQRQFRPGLFAGIRYTYRWGKVFDTTMGGVLEAGTITGSTTGRASGVGVLLSWDTRDNLNSPAKGSFVQASATFHAPLLGSDYRLDAYTLDLRHYMTISGPQVLALQLATTLTTGSVPFRMLPGIGEQLRGYNSMRYIDKDRIVLQAEYRVVPVWWRLGLTVFGGLGEVADRIEDFSFSRPKWAVGVGLRFLLFAEEKVTIRQDFAFGLDSSGDYLDLNEAF